MPRKRLARLTVRMIATGNVLQLNALNLLIPVVILSEMKLWESIAQVWWTWRLTEDGFGQKHRELGSRV